MQLGIKNLHSAHANDYEPKYNLFKENMKCLIIHATVQYKGKLTLQGSEKKKAITY